MQVLVKDSAAVVRMQALSSALGGIPLSGASHDTAAAAAGLRGASAGAFGSSGSTGGGGAAGGDAVSRSSGQAEGSRAEADGIMSPDEIRKAAAAAAERGATATGSGSTSGAGSNAASGASILGPRVATRVSDGGGGSASTAGGSAADIGGSSSSSGGSSSSRDGATAASAAKPDAGAAAVNSRVWDVGGTHAPENDQARSDALLAAV